MQGFHGCENPGMEIKTQRVIEFGQTVTLYRVVNTETGKSTLWHSTEEKALDHYNSSPWYSTPKRRVA